MHIGSPRPYTRESEFAAMVRDHQAALWRYLRYLGCDPALAEDLVQDTLQVALEKSPQTLRRPRAWLAAVCRNLLRQHRTRR